MVTKNDVKFINSLKHKKYRQLNNCFIVEGKKSIIEFLKSDYQLIKLFSVDCSFFSKIKNQVKIENSLLRKISFLINPDDHVAIFKLNYSKPIDNENLIIALDSIRDPGNLGTIIRTCEWFGIKDIICSNDSVDCYGPKVIQSAMGSVSRVNITYLDLIKYLKSSKSKKIITSLNGESIYKYDESFDSGILVFGNEANGVSKEFFELMDYNISIPRFKNNKFPESLNLASSLGIILSEISRKSI
ncbi:MAG: RNA methyltransferase [Flavobacteriaceae bacterium]|nr:RNA methyltransferase [Flavobacteriaceae bacterium]|tara:strand:+ start:5588 stop:6319 length:732 start_codon:yes stop_codon:yes gene_type:complete